MSELKKGIITRVDSNNTKMQTVQVEGFAGETTDKVERYQQYGFSSHPVNMNPDTGHASEVIIAELNSNDLSVVIATDDRRYRPISGFEGDVQIYGKHDTPSANNDDATHRISLTDDGGANYRTILKTNNCNITLNSEGYISISNGSGIIMITPTGLIIINGPTIYLNGNVEVSGTITCNGVNISDTHTHGNVQPGGGSTGVPQ